MSDRVQPLIDGLEAELLDRYAAGTCTPDELQRVTEWAAHDSDRAMLVSRLDELRAHATTADAGWDLERAWTRARRNVLPAVQLYRADLSRPTTRMDRLSSRAVYGAATAALVASAALSAIVIHGRGTTARDATHEYVTVRGERAIVHLGDGTQVTLGPATRLRVALGARQRDLVLDGEALFDVAHDPARPFRVRTTDAVTEDVGTAFDVREYAGDSGTRVIVRAGRVTLQPSVGGVHARAVDLGVDESGLVPHGGLTPIVGRVEADAAIRWVDGWLTFQNATVAAAAADLGRWYDLDIELDPAVAGRRLVASFQAPTADEALHIVATALGVRVERRGRHVVIAPAAASVSGRGS